MGFLDKVKETAGKAAEQAKHQTAVAKEKMEDAKLGKKVNELCAEIGRLVVSQRRGEAPVDADAQIDAKIAEITALEQQMEDNAVAKPADADGGGGAADTATGDTPTDAPT